MSFLSDLMDKGKSLFGGQDKPPTETEAIKRNSFDRSDYERVLETSPVIQQMEKKLEQTVDYAADFLADLHAGLFKVEPSVRSVEEMKPTHVANRAVMEQLLNMPEMHDLRQHSAGNVYSSAMAMLSLQDKAVETLNQVHEAAKEEAEKQEQQQKDREERQKEIEQAIEELKNNPPPEPLPEGAEGPEAPPDPRVDGLKQQIDEFGQMPVPGNGSVQQAAKSAAEGFGQKMRAAAKATSEQMDTEKQLMQAFGIENGELQKMSFEERAKLAQRLANNRLAAFAKLLGQFKMVQQAESRHRVVNAASEVVGITFGDDLARMASSELLNFADESLEDLMWLRWSEGQMVINDMRGKEKQGQGPIICVVDESASMTKPDIAGGTREAWSKGLALALCDQAKRRNRDFVYIGFASAGQQRVVEFMGGETPLEKVLDMTENFLKGGTNFEQPLKMALKMIEEQFVAKAKPRPDIVFITDDEYGPMDQTFMAEWNRVKDKTDLKCYGIAVGTSIGGALTAVSDNIREIRELVSDPRNVGDLFRTI
jgi:uncharacterized protein with von Willebrand factor type A (vWA) domain